MADLTDRRDAVVVRYDEERLRFEPRDDHYWRLYHETWTGCHWRTRGTQLVDSLRVYDP